MAEKCLAVIYSCESAQGVGLQVWAGPSHLAMTCFSGPESRGVFVQQRVTKIIAHENEQSSQNPLVNCHTCQLHDITSWVPSCYPPFLERRGGWHSRQQQENKHQPHHLPRFSELGALRTIRR